MRARGKIYLVITSYKSDNYSTEHVEGAYAKESTALKVASEYQDMTHDEIRADVKEYRIRY